ncbi:DUF3078 domain-containing protein [Poritiphilus flavus]|uniref:DUF3078 domain-containing protein n=1 Tax=Poritiphilus flavus TaxID=2697053 RepID=A0A6L9E7T8_9FLAO|nr:DUF3078 domain-containing protein [Poritiphilus flavus]NAS10797.1 DUF3078 domain-containing protein [Poritiphilus flavus]
MRILRRERILYSCLLFLAGAMLHAQDSIPTPATPDTTVVDTIVIRKQQEQIRFIPRGVQLRNPGVSFNRTKPLTQRFKRFRPPSFWEKRNKITVNLSEVAFVNWNAGGDNSVSAIGNAIFARNYKFRYVQWNNDLELRFGWNAQEGRVWRKTDDAIRLSSTFGYRQDTISSWYYSVKANLNTQFADGFKYPDRETPISRFMAPGYLFMGAGASYIPEGKNFNLYISPITLKSTFVLDQDLADRGAFGVDKAVLDDEGNVLVPGKNTFMELGFLLTNSLEKQVLKNVVMNHKLSMYTDYLRSFGNVDIDWQLNFDLTVNKYINANIGTHIIYDDDILFDEQLAEDGTVTDPGEPRIQFKQLLGIGMAYTF